MRAHMASMHLQVLQPIIQLKFGNWIIDHLEHLLEFTLINNYYIL